MLADTRRPAASGEAALGSRFAMRLAVARLLGPCRMTFPLRLRGALRRRLRQLRGLGNKALGERQRRQLDPGQLLNVLEVRPLVRRDKADRDAIGSRAG